jgi:hypothetical protein
MTESRIDWLARRCAAGLDRRQLAAGVLTVFAGGVALPGSARAGCKKVGKKCDKNQDCCDHAECKGRECTCKNGFEECDGKCFDLDREEKHCGACDSPCAAEESCCDGTCVDLATDLGNCGACGRACDETEECVAGVCTTPPGGCPPGADTCAGIFVSCTGGAPCVCLQSTEGATLCGDQSTPGAICGQCESSADCAEFGPGAFCATTCCPGDDNFCRLPCGA